MTKAYHQNIEQWQACTATTAAELKQHIGGFPVLFAYHSGKIENDAVGLRHIRSTFAAGRIEGYAGTPQTLAEMYKQKMCNAFLTPKLIAREPSHFIFASAKTGFSRRKSSI